MNHSQNEQRHHFTSRVGSFASATTVSRILGYVRDALVAYFFGGGGVTDAFYAAFRIPNLLRRFFGEGSFTAAFVPIFTETIETKDEQEVRRFFNSIFSGLFVLLTLLVVGGIFAAPLVTKLAAWGFSREPEKLNLTIQLVRLTFPFLLFVSLAALATSALNARGRFFIPALAPAGLSIAEIAFMLFLASRFRQPIYGLAISAAVGGLLHWAIQLPSLSREGLPLRFTRPAYTDTTRILKLMAPTVIGLSADQINSYVDTLCGSFLATGSVTALYNSNRVMQLPLALFGVAVASVALPALSRSMAKENMQEYKNTLTFSLRSANFLIIPATVGLIVIGHPIVQLLFQHGHFTPHDTDLTYMGLVGFTLGLPAYSGTKILASAFFAFKDTFTPMRAALWAMVVNVGLDITLMWKFGVGGLSFATSASAWMNMMVLFFLLRNKVGIIGGKDVVISGAKITGASCLMSAAAWWLVYHLPGPLFIRVMAAILVGCGVFLGLAILMKLEELKAFRSWLPKFARTGTDLDSNE
jgi:putative peptidoglycan lipid II flippase